MYLTLISDGLKDQGYVTDERMRSPDVNAGVRDVTNELMSMAAAFAVGTVLEQRGGFVGVRRNRGSS